MAGKIRAAVDARVSEETLIIARTDAEAVEGLEAALERAEAYAEAGADILFVEAPQSERQLAEVGERLRGVRPLMANMVDGGDTPPVAHGTLAEMGYRLVIFPGGIVRALARSAQDYYRSLALHRSNLPFAEKMFDFAGLNALIGTPEMLALGRAYEGEAT
jgi:2-methylisocitrate lyase-like PEP mutase family enzyme